MERMKRKKQKPYCAASVANPASKGELPRNTDRVVQKRNVTRFAFLCSSPHLARKATGWNTENARTKAADQGRGNHEARCVIRPSRSSLAGLRQCRRVGELTKRVSMNADIGPPKADLNASTATRSS